VQRVYLIVYTRNMTRRTSLELDEVLLDRSQRILGTSGIRETVEAAFREIIRADRRNRLRERIRSGAGMDSGPAMLAATRPEP
jgi:Arc/MetJ family transcription regulator